MTDDPVDLSSLDPSADKGQYDALIARIVADGLDARRARAESPDDVLAQLGRWSGPALAAAALILAVSIPTAIRSGRALATTTVAAPPPPDRWGLPAIVATLVQSGRSPTAIDIVAAFNARWMSGGE